MSGQEKRGAPRIWTELWVMVEGVDDRAVLRRANLSVSGVLFESTMSLGETGTVEYLHLTDPERTVGVQVMSQLVRHVSYSDLQRGQRLGLGFHFFPQNAEIKRQVRRLFQTVVNRQATLNDLRVDHEVPAELELPESAPRAAPKPATVFQLAVNRMQLETSWPVSVGEQVQIVFRSARGQTRIPFEGTVNTVSPRDGGRYAVDVEVASAGMRAAPKTGAAQQQSITQSIDLIFSDLMTDAPRAAPQQAHLKGRLDRISLSSLVALLDMERMSGELRLKHGANLTTLYFAGGQLVDVEPSGDAHPRAALARVWSDTSGTFAFTQVAVERKDRFEIPTTALFLDLAREADEASREET